MHNVSLKYFTIFIFLKRYFVNKLNRGALFYLTTRIITALRTFRVTVGGAAIAAIPICRELEVDVLQSNALHDSKKCLKKEQEMFPFGTQTRRT